MKNSIKKVKLLLNEFKESFESKHNTIDLIISREDSHLKKRRFQK